jgi:TrmH family RNA methyltransferase
LLKLEVSNQNQYSRLLSKNKIKQLRSLHLKKFRRSEGLFVAEGQKLVFDLLESDMKVHEIFCTPEFIAAVEGKGFPPKNIHASQPADLKKISQLKSSPDIIAAVHIPAHSLSWEELAGDLCLALDGVQDPGNLGTIIRLADWFGIRNILCSGDTVDLYNPKTVQATMGAIARIRVHYGDLPGYLQHAGEMDIPVYGTFLEGENLYSAPLSPNGIIVMGNEGKGISGRVEPLIQHKIHIPNYPADRMTSESLNVAMATSITCSEFRRRMMPRKP